MPDLAATLEPRADAPPAPVRAPRSRSLRDRRVQGAVAVAALVYSWWASAHEPFTTYAAIAVGVPIGLCAIVLSATWRRRHPRFHVRPARPHRGTVRFYAAAVTLLVAWEIRELLGSPRAAYPTVSSLVDHVVAFRPSHAAAFWLWLALGYLLLKPARRA